MTYIQERRAEFERLNDRVEALTSLLASWPLVKPPTPALIESQVRDLADALSERVKVAADIDRWTATWSSAKRPRLCPACEREFSGVSA